jgi:hypothetical protein
MRGLELKAKKKSPSLSKKKRHPQEMTGGEKKKKKRERICNSPTQLAMYCPLWALPSSRVCSW